MKFQAIRLFQEDGRRVSRYVEQGVDDLDAGEVVIRAHFAAVNYKDARAVSGEGNVVKRFPCVPGIEVSGVVVSSTSAAFREGDAVTVQGGQEFGIRHDGAYAEYVRVPAAWVVPLPAGFDLMDVVGLGIGAYTSALAVAELMRRGVTPDRGPVIVTGATGGCSSFAIDMLAARGFHVAACTGKTGEAAYLKELGAAEVIGRDAIVVNGRPLDEQRWAGAIDAVGGKPLVQVLSTMKQRGVVCCFGNAAGETFDSSIYPFILRSVELAGINANHPVARRTDAWSRMARGGDLRPRHLERICFEIPFAGLKDYCESVVAGGIRGRAVVRFPAAA